MIRLKRLLEQIIQNTDAPKELDTIRVVAPKADAFKLVPANQDKVKTVRKKRESQHAANLRLAIAAVDKLLSMWNLQGKFKLSPANQSKLNSYLANYNKAKRIFNIKPITDKHVRQNEGDAWIIIEAPKYVSDAFMQEPWMLKPNKKDSDNMNLYGTIVDLERLAVTLDDTYQEQRGAQWGDMFGGHKL